MITTVDIRTGKVTQRPLTEQEIASLPVIDTEKEERERINLESRNYLKETDWYVIRFVDEGTPIPEDIQLKRKEARAKVVE